MAQQTPSPTNRPARFDRMCADSSWTVIPRMPCPHRGYHAIAMPREKALPIASQVPEQDGFDGQPADRAAAGCLGRDASWLPRANWLAPAPGQECLSEALRDSNGVTNDAGPA
jgi:hypothetical protein